MKKITLFYGQTDLQSRVGQLGLFFFLIFKKKILVQKLPWKDRIFEKQIWLFFAKISLKYILIYFQHFSDKIIKFWLWNSRFYKISANWKKKNLSNRKKWVSPACKTGFSFFVALLHISWVLVEKEFLKLNFADEI